MLSDKRIQEINDLWLPVDTIAAATDDDPMIEMHLTAEVTLAIDSAIKQALAEQEAEHDKQLATMREVLEFYADADNYYDAPSFVPLVPLDGGEKAKKALEIE